MKYLVAWKAPPGQHRACAQEFLRTGAPLPETLKLIGRWHAPGSARGWVILEGDDEVAIAQHAGQWASYLEMDITPVIDDATAAKGLSRALES